LLCICLATVLICYVNLFHTVFFFACTAHRPPLHSFPTRRSSDLSYDDLPLFLNSELVAKVLGVSPSSGYELMHQPDFPVHQFIRSEEHTSELQSRFDLVCRLLLEKKKLVGIIFFIISFAIRKIRP